MNVPKRKYFLVVDDILISFCFDFLFHLRINEKSAEAR